MFKSILDCFEEFDKLSNNILKNLSKEYRHVRVILEKQILKMSENFDIDFIKFI